MGKFCNHFVTTLGQLSRTFVRLFEQSLVGLRVDKPGFDILMAQQLLHDSNIIAQRDQVCAECVAERIQWDKWMMEIRRPP